MTAWSDRLKERVQKNQADRIYWIARGCCTSEARKKYVEKGLVPAEIVPMSEADKEHFRIAQQPMRTVERRRPVKSSPAFSREEIERILQKTARESFRMKLLAEVAMDMTVSKHMETDPFEYPKQLRDELSAICEKEEADENT